MRFTKRSARDLAASKPQPKTFTTPTESEPVRWSDIAASRKSTHPTVAPIKRILETTELCENVLQYIPPRDLVLLRRVCRAINAVINTSPVLQTKLFLKGVSSSENIPWVLDRDLGLLAGAQASECIKRSKTAPGPAPRTVQVFVYNPLVLSKSYSNEDRGLLSRLECYDQFEATHQDNLSLRADIKSQLSALSGKASCLAMLLSQPPLTKITVEARGMCEYEPWVDRRGLPRWYNGCIGRKTIANDRGVTVSQLVDTIRFESRRGAQDYILYTDDFGVRSDQKEFVERVGRVTEDTDPWRTSGKAGKK